MGDARIVINEPEPDRRHPCERGDHTWRWAWLAAGGKALLCRVCGTDSGRRAR